VSRVAAVAEVDAVAGGAEVLGPCCPEVGTELAAVMVDGGWLVGAGVEGGSTTDTVRLTASRWLSGPTATTR
jgi:hypothetical protein